MRCFNNSTLCASCRYNRLIFNLLAVHYLTRMLIASMNSSDCCSSLWSRSRCLYLIGCSTIICIICIVWIACFIHNASWLNCIRHATTIILSFIICWKNIWFETVNIFYYILQRRSFWCWNNNNFWIYFAS